MKKVILLPSVMLFCINLFAQSRIISGTVTDKNSHDRLIGVTVILKGTQTASTTDEQGQYTLAIPEAGGTLVFSYIGYKAFTSEVTDQSIFDVGMDQGQQVLDEVLVVGYGTQIKSQVTGSITVVGSDQIENTPVTSVEQTLQGKAAGVFVETNNGKVGSAIRVRVRGSTSIKAGNEPLYVVDGVPINTAPVNDQVNLNLNPLNDINFNEIASVSVLKDASASAIYGSRGANGVVLITTKRGKEGKPKINFDLQTGWSKPTHLREFLNSQQYISFFEDAAVRGGKYAYLTGRGNYGSEQEAIDHYTTTVHDQFTQLSGWADWTKNEVNTDWQSYAFQKAMSTSANLTISGGTDKLQYLVGTGYSQQDGILINNSMSRANGIINLDSKISEKFKYGISLNFSRSVNHDIPNDDYFSNPVQIVAASPISPLRDLNGEYSVEPVTTYSNPLIEAKYTTAHIYTFRTIGNVFAEVTPIRDFTLRGEAGGDITNLAQDRFSGSKSNTGFGIGGYGEVYNARVENYDTKLLLKYNHEFQERHNVDATVGFEYQPFVNLYSELDGQGFPNDQLKTLASVSEIVYGTSNLEQYRFLSYFARANYNYEEKYLLSLTARIDGSSRFGQDHRYGLFPSGSIGWIISKESFLANNPILSFLKLRASYGVTGNAEIGNFNFLGLYGVSTYNASAGLYPSTLANPDLTWEKTAQFDGGLDFGILNDRINGVVDYYIKNTSDLLLDVPIPSTTGFLTQTRNVGKMQNKGFEFEVNGDILVKNFKWNASLNFAANKNKVVALEQGQSLIDDAGASGLNVVKVGEPLGVFYGPEYAGVDPANGDALFYVNGPEDDRATTNDFNLANFVVIGNPNPKFIAGFTNSFSFKNFSLDISLQSVYGNDINLNGDHWMNSNGGFWDNQIVKALNSWKNPGDITDVPESRYGFDNGDQFRSSRYVTSGSYLRVKTITLGYNIPVKILQKIKISQLRVYASAYNLFTITNYDGWDPEVSTDFFADNINVGIDFYSAPQPKTIVFGISLGF
ncbi:MAG: TonB-dependent receptor [Chitinophagales bacterium]|nr:TonB-dependent receptor [Chitinophagales bacterium]